MRSLILVLCSTLAVLGVARADTDTKERARRLYDDGLRHYNVAAYEEAITAWKEAYLLSKRPLLLFNMGQAYRLSGDCTQALRLYDSYLREEPSPKNQDELEQAQATCRAKLAAAPPAPPPARVEAPTTLTPVSSAAASPPRDAPPRSEEGRGQHTVGLVLGATGLALGGTALYFALDARSQADELDAFAGEWGDAQRAIEQRGTRSEKLAWGIGAASVATIGVGIVLLVLAGSADEPPAVAITPTAGGAHVSWAIGF